MPFQTSASPDPLNLSPSQPYEGLSSRTFQLSSFREMSATSFRRSRSTRVPDFIRLRVYLDDNFRCIGSRVDLIIELKRRGTNRAITRRLLAKALRQVGEQARHAFQQDDDLIVVGFIIAAGNVWQYGELDRTDTLEVPNPNRDNTYTPTTPPTSECRSSISVTPEAHSRRATTTRVTSPNVLRSSNPSPASQAQIRLDTMEWPRLYKYFFA